MELGTLLVCIAIGLVILILILFPEARKLLLGFTRIFIKDMASTPEGARAIYEEKIEEATQAYNTADEAFKLAAGKLSNARRDMDNLKNKIARVEKECEALVKEGKYDSAQLKAEEREEVLSDIKRCSELIKAYEDTEATAKEVHNLCETNLRKLKRESKEIVENMKVKEQLKSVYDGMDKLKAVTATDKLLETVREKNNDLNTVVEGSKVVHNNKLSTKIQKAETDAKKVSSNDYLEGLKKKYNK